MIFFFYFFFPLWNLKLQPPGSWVMGGCEWLVICTENSSSAVWERWGFFCSSRGLAVKICGSPFSPEGKKPNKPKKNNSWSHNKLFNLITLILLSHDLDFLSYNYHFMLPGVGIGVSHDRWGRIGFMSRLADSTSWRLLALASATVSTKIQDKFLQVRILFQTRAASLIRCAI